jgi:DNA-binding IclR family transcriptional regulator
MSWALPRPRQQRVVLQALAEVGAAGMTPNSLEVVTELPEPRLHAILNRLIEAGLVCRRGDPGMFTNLGANHYLLTMHADVH